MKRPGMNTLLIATRNAHKVAEIRAMLGEQFTYLTLEDLPHLPEVVEDANSFAGNATKKAVEIARWLAAAAKNPIPGVRPSRAHERPMESGREAKSGAFGLPGPVAPEDGRAPLTPKSAENPAMLVLADDSGLEVDALKGAPGVHSARFAGLEAGRPGNSPDADNIAKLLRLLKDVPTAQRTARFRCVLALTPVLDLPVASSSSACQADGLELQTELFDGTCEGRIGFAPRGNGGFGYDPLFIPVGHEQTFAELGERAKNRLSHRARALAKLKASRP